MKTNLSIILILITVVISLVGCKTTSFERGVIAGTAATKIFDAPQDEAKFQRIKADIIAYLATDKPITEIIVSSYLEKISEDFSPAFITIVRTRLESELPGTDLVGVGKIDDSRIREFLTGIAASI